MDDKNKKFNFKIKISIIIIITLSILCILYNMDHITNYINSYINSNINQNTNQLGGGRGGAGSDYVPNNYLIPGIKISHSSVLCKPVNMKIKKNIFNEFI